MPTRQQNSRSGQRYFLTRRRSTCTSPISAGRSCFDLTLTLLWHVLLAILIRLQAGPFLRILPDQVDDPRNDPVDDAEQPEVAPETPGEKVAVQIDAGKDQRQPDKADDRKPAQIAVEHALEQGLGFEEALSTLNGIIKSEQKTGTAEDKPGPEKMKRLGP